MLVSSFNLSQSYNTRFISFTKNGSNQSSILSVYGPCCAACKSPSLLQVVVSSCSVLTFPILVWISFKTTDTGIPSLTRESKVAHTEISHTCLWILANFYTLHTDCKERLSSIHSLYVFPSYSFVQPLLQSSQAYIWPLLCIARIYMRQHIYCIFLSHMSYIIFF
jgi:hypothetical protein